MKRLRNCKRVHTESNARPSADTNACENWFFARHALKVAVGPTGFNTLDLKSQHVAVVSGCQGFTGKPQTNGTQIQLIVRACSDWPRMDHRTSHHIWDYLLILGSTYYLVTRSLLLGFEIWHLTSNSPMALFVILAPKTVHTCNIKIPETSFHSVQDTFFDWS